MEMIGVSSRAMIAVGYDKDRQQLHIQFKQGGQIYSYCRVPQSIHQSLMSASSKGGYYDRFIKDKFAC
jgi:hypothetical protein